MDKFLDLCVSLLNFKQRHSRMLSLILVLFFSSILFLIIITIMCFYYIVMVNQIKELGMQNLQLQTKIEYYKGYCNYLEEQYQAPLENQ